MDSERDFALMFRQNLLPILLGLLGLVFVIIGLFQFFMNKSEPSPLVFEEAKEVEGKVVVDVEGAVIKPGVYSLSSKSRTVDALAAAGGLSEDADRDYVEKNINLAKKVSDGLKIYIPRVGEQVLSVASDKNGPVMNINSASSSELESLAGVGAVTAQKIIDGRPYSDIEDLLVKKIVSKSTFNKIKDQIAAN